MKFTFKKLGFQTGGLSVLVINENDAFQMGAKPGGRTRIFRLSSDNKIIEPGIIAIIDIAKNVDLIPSGVVGLYDEIVSKLDLSEQDSELQVFLSPKPKTYSFIRKKVKGHKLSTHEIMEIVKHVNRERLIGVELASFLTGIEIHGMTDDEVVDFANAFAQSGDILDLGPECYDKHSTGGVPGNKVSLIIVPIIAAAGLLIPKTSTRAITSPSGTADSYEVFANIAFEKEKVLEILNQNRAAIFWAGAMNSAPAADVLIEVQKQLNVDPLPLMLASILSKKLAMGVKVLVLDIPVGKGTKFPTVEEGRKYAVRFKECAQRVGIDATCVLTSASQPIGHTVGPALEAREALQLLRDPSIGPSSLLNKSTDLAGILLEKAGKAPKGGGKTLATDLLFSGKAYMAFKNMIQIQGGNPDIIPEEIEVGPYTAEIKTEFDGIVASIDNHSVNRIAKLAGCPAAKAAGVVIDRKIGKKIKAGTVILKIYSPNQKALEKAVEYSNAHPVLSLASMTIDTI